MARRRVRFAVLAAVAAVVLGGLGAYSLATDGVVYYHTPSELVDDPPPSDRQVRLGGLVVEDSIARDGDVVRFVLTDGVAEVEVAHDGEVRGVFQEGQGALVEGHPDGAGGFRSELVMVQHDNTYETEPADGYQPPEDDDEASPDVERGGEAGR